MKKYVRIGAMLVALSIVSGMMTGCGKSKKSSLGLDSTTPGFSVMTSATRSTPAGQDSPVVQEMQRYLGEKMSEKYGKEYEKVNLDLQWIASTAYNEKVTAAMGAGEYPHMMLVQTRNSSVIQNSKAGTFWDITDIFTKTDKRYITEENPEGYVYPHLAKANKTINRNISVSTQV